ncbi:MAG: amidohydrolase family protein [Eubacteriales bacterium]
MYKIFDAHTHTYPEKISGKACENLGQFYDFKVWGKGTYSDLESQAKDCGVAGFMLFSVATNATQVQKVNDSIASLAKISRSRGFETVGYAGMHQDYPDFAAELDRCLEMGLRGVKIHPDIQRVDIDDPRMLRLCALMEERGMTLFLHMGDNRPQYRYSEPKKLAHILSRFPSLRVVAAHMGGYKAWEEAERYIYGNPNVWYDISSTLWAITPQTAASLIHKCGAERVMFGTDYPVYNLRDYISLFMKIELTEEERGDILDNNAARFFDLANIAELDN